MVRPSAASSLRTLHLAVIEAAARFRADPSHAPAVDALAGAIRALAFATARRLTHAADADDAANDVTLKCLAALRAGRVSEGSEGTYVRRASHHRVCSAFRSQRRFQPTPDEGEGGSFEAARYQLTSPPPDEVLASDAARDAHEWRLETLGRIAAAAPSPHREILAAHLAGHSTKELVSREMASRTDARRSSPEDARAACRLRAALDQRLCRAKGWVRKHWDADPLADVA